MRLRCSGTETWIGRLAAGIYPTAKLLIYIWLAIFATGRDAQELQLQIKLRATPKFIYRPGYVAERLPKMMACRFASPNGLLRSSKALSQYRLPSSLLLSWPSPRRSQQDEDDAHPHRPGH